MERSYLLSPEEVIVLDSIEGENVDFDGVRSVVQKLRPRKGGLAKIWTIRSQRTGMYVGTVDEAIELANEYIGERRTKDLTFASDSGIRVRYLAVCETGWGGRQKVEILKVHSSLDTNIPGSLSIPLLRITRRSEGYWVDDFGIR